MTLKRPRLEKWESSWLTLQKHVEGWNVKFSILDIQIPSQKLVLDTPPKTNMEPENEPLEEEIPIKNHHF